MTPYFPLINDVLYARVFIKPTLNKNTGLYLTT